MGFRSRVENIFYRIAKGEIPKESLVGVGGDNPNMSANVEETIWDPTGFLDPLTSEERFYISSTDPSDIGIIIGTVGNAGDFNVAVRTGTLNGQNQVALSGDLLLCSQAFTLSGTPNGDIYIARADAAPGGIPAADKIQCKIFSGRGAGFTSIRAVPPNSSWILRSIEYTTGKLKDIDIFIKSKPFGGDWTSFPAAHLAEAVNNPGKDSFTRFPEKTILKIDAIARDDGAKLSVGLLFAQVEE